MIEELQRTVITLSKENKELNERNEFLRRELVEIGTKHPGLVPVQALMRGGALASGSANGGFVGGPNMMDGSAVAARVEGLTANPGTMKPSSNEDPATAAANPQIPQVAASSSSTTTNTNNNNNNNTVNPQQQMALMQQMLMMQQNPAMMGALNPALMGMMGMGAMGQQQQQGQPQQQVQPQQQNAGKESETVQQQQPQQTQGEDQV